MNRLLLILMFAVPATAIPGDIDRDGDVDLDDFFLLGDNFGKEGPVEAIMDTITVEVQEVRYDTLVIDHVTVFDTIFYGREEIRFDPPPPPGEITQALQLRTAFVNRIFSSGIMLELTNGSTASLRSLDFRLTVRDDAGSVLYTQNFRNDVSRLIAGDTRAVHMSFFGESEEVLDNARAGNFEIDIV